MALAGTLKDFSLADIFQLIGLQRKTGILTLTKNKVEAVIFFHNGLIVGADTNENKLENRLGRVLVKTNHLSQEQLDRALEIQAKTLQRLGQIIIGEGFISHEELKTALRIQVTEIIYKLFRWKDGDYHFRQEKYVDYDQDFFDPISAESILMEGIRMVDEWPMIEKAIPSYDILVERTELGEQVQVQLTMPDDDTATLDTGPTEGYSLFDDEPQAKIKVETETGERTFKINSQQRTVLNLIDGPSMVQEIMDKSKLGEFETCRALYDLMEMGLAQAMTKDAMNEDVKLVEERHVPVWVPGSFVVVIAIVSFFIQWNPLNRLVPAMNRTIVSESHFAAASKVGMNRISEALWVYYMQYQQLPVNLGRLVDRHLLEEGTLTDPLGRPYRYELNANSNAYTIYGVSLDGANRAAYSLTKEFVFSNEVP